MLDLLLLPSKCIMHMHVRYRHFVCQQRTTSATASQWFLPIIYCVLEVSLKAKLALTTTMLSNQFIQCYLMTTTTSYRYNRKLCSDSISTLWNPIGAIALQSVTFTATFVVPAQWPCHLWTLHSFLLLHLTNNNASDYWANGLGLGLGVRYSPLVRCIINCNPSSITDWSASRPTYISRDTVTTLHCTVVQCVLLGWSTAWLTRWRHGGVGYICNVMGIR